MNKKTLFLVLSTVLVIFPVTTFAQGNVPQGLIQIIANVRAAVTMIGGAMVIIGFVIAGILYLGSFGSPEKTTTAKKALIAAVIGGVLVALANAANALVNILNGILGV